MTSELAKSSERDVTTLPLSQTIIKLLNEKGFLVVKDLVGMRPLELSQELGISSEQALSIIKCLEPSSSALSAPTAKDLLQKREIGKPIITFCKNVDKMIGGGVPIGQITEICGSPGIGKTQFAIQLGLNVQIPEAFKGNGCECIYVDTEGSFMVERAAEMASSLTSHLFKISKHQMSKQGVDLEDIAASMTRDRFLEGINVIRVHDSTEILAVVNQLPSWLKFKSKVRLLIIDSIAFPFRQNIGDLASRSRILSGLAQDLNKIAFEFNIAVVVTNHITTKIDRRSGSGGGGGGAGAGGATALVPALGDQWSHCITNRIMLQWDGNDRRAVVAKSPAWPPSSCLYRICEMGVRDVRTEEEAPRKRSRVDKGMAAVDKNVEVEVRKDTLGIWA